MTTDLLVYQIFQKDVLASDEEMVDDPDTPGGYLKRKKIRKVQGTKKLKEETKAAQKAEEDRRKRIEERQKEVCINLRYLFK